MKNCLYRARLATARGCVMAVNAARAGAEAIACSSMAVSPCGKTNRSVGNATVHCSTGSIPSAEAILSLIARNTPSDDRPWRPNSLLLVHCLPARGLTQLTICR
jgi:hypothetical protein